MEALFYLELSEFLRTTQRYNPYDKYHATVRYIVVMVGCGINSSKMCRMANLDKICDNTLGLP
jgi:hypothetical protein